MKMILIQLNLDLIQYEVHVIDEDDEMHVVEL